LDEIGIFSAAALPNFSAARQRLRSRAVRFFSSAVAFCTGLFVSESREVVCRAGPIAGSTQRQDRTSSIFPEIQRGRQLNPPCAIPSKAGGVDGCIPRRRQRQTSERLSRVRAAAIRCCATARCTVFGKRVSRPALAADPSPCTILAAYTAGFGADFTAGSRAALP